MNLIVVILLLIGAYLIYSMLESYKELAKEIREIRLKCINPPPNIKTPIQINAKAPEDVLSTTLGQARYGMINTLQNISTKLKYRN